MRKRSKAAYAFPALIQLMLETINVRIASVTQRAYSKNLQIDAVFSEANDEKLCKFYMFKGVTVS